MSGELYIVAKIEIKKAYREEFLSLAKGLVEASSSEDGNIFYVLNESIDNPELFFFIEQWKSQQAIEFHNKTEHFAKFAEFVKEKSLEVSSDIVRPVITA